MAKSRYSIALGTTFILLGSIGLGRFAYGAIVPLMVKSLSLNSFQVGLIAAGQNSCYLLFAWFSGKIVQRAGFRRLISVSLGLCGLCTFSTGLSTNFITSLIPQSLAGAFSALATIPCYGLVYGSSKRSDLGRGIGITNGGPGLGLFLTGVIEPLFSSDAINLGWRFSWFFYGTLIVGISLLAPLLLPDGTKQNTTSEAKQEKSQTREKRIVLKLTYLGMIYFFFGLVYIIYITYFPSFITIEPAFGIANGASIWQVLGPLAAISGLVLGSISDKIGRMKALALGYILLSTSPLAAILFQSSIGVYVSAILFGIFLFGIPTVVITMAGSFVSEKAVTEAVGFVTIFFGFGQALGPALAGYVSYQEHSYDYVFLLSSSLAFVGFLLTAGGGIYQTLSAGFQNRKQFHRASD